jgi:CRISPR-associated protein Cas2
MVEVGVGVFLGVKISPAVRERILNVLSDWFAAEKEASLVIVWDDPNKPGGLAVKVMGWPPVELVEVNGILITRR